MVKLHYGSLVQMGLGQDVTTTEFATLDALIKHSVELNCFMDPGFNHVITVAYDSNDKKISEAWPSFFITGMPYHANAYIESLAVFGRDHIVFGITDVFVFEWETYEDALKCCHDMAEQSPAAMNE